MPITKVNSLGVSLTSPVTFPAGTVSLPSITTSGDTNTGAFFPAADTMAFAEGGTEVMRVSPLNYVFINTTSNAADAGLQVFSKNNSTDTCFFYNNADLGTTRNIINCFAGTFGISAEKVFGVFTNGNAVNKNNSYGAISDIKFKKDIVDANSQWNDIKNIKIRKFKFKNDLSEKNQIGVIAQELELISPNLIEETQNQKTVSVPVLNKDGNPIYNEDGTPKFEFKLVNDETTNKVVKYSILYMKSVKALQEAMERIEQLEARLTALESK